MKKNIVYLLIAILFTVSVKAQEKIVQTQAVINADGSRQINATDASGKTIKISAANDAELKTKYLELIKKQSDSIKPSLPEQKIQIVAHRAVLGLNGKQQIIVTFASGQEKTIDAVEGQSIQQTYLAYLKKEGLDCGCSPVNAPVDSQITTRTATRNGSIPNQ